MQPEAKTSGPQPSRNPDSCLCTPRLSTADGHRRAEYTSLIHVILTCDFSHRDTDLQMPQLQIFRFLTDSKVMLYVLWCTAQVGSMELGLHVR